MHQSIDPREHGGESNIYPVLKDGLFPRAPGSRNLFKAPHSGGIQTSEANEEAIQIGIVRLGHVAKVKTLPVFVH